MGCDISGHLWSARLLHTDPDAIYRAHMAYLQAGAQIIISASYQVSRHGFRRASLSDEDADDALAASVALARAARDDFAEENPTRPPALVAASVGPYGATLHDGSEYTGAYAIDTASLREFHRERLDILDHSGADLLACETIPSLDEARVLEALLRSAKTPAWVSFSCRNSRQISDSTPVDVAAALFRDHPGVFAVGVNCTAPNHVLELVRRIHRAAPHMQIVAYPNSGESYAADSNSWHGDALDDSFPAQARAWHAAGASIIGGCCRVGPEGIVRLRALWQED
jgi:homocysteine S-methyltransferase